MVELMTEDEWEQADGYIGKGYQDPEDEGRKFVRKPRGLVPVEIIDDLRWCHNHAKMATAGSDAEYRGLHIEKAGPHPEHSEFHVYNDGNKIETLTLSRYDWGDLNR